MDAPVSVFRNGVSEWMDLSRNGWSCLGVSGGVSERCFGMDGPVSVFRNGVSEWMVLSLNGWSYWRCFGQKCFGNSKSGWSCGWSCLGCFGIVFRNWMVLFDVDGPM